MAITVKMASTALRCAFGSKQILFLIFGRLVDCSYFCEQKKNTMIANYQDREEKLARFAKALGHPARIAILHFLAGRESCFFGDIHDVLPIAKATVSQHLSELKSAGLIQGEIQPPKVKYCIHRENWQLAKQLFADFFHGLDKCTAKGGGCCS